MIALEVMRIASAIAIGYALTGWGLDGNRWWLTAGLIAIWCNLRIAIIDRGSA